jgi:hypothetical protein
MTRADSDDLPWPPPRRARAAPRHSLAAAATQIVGNADDYLGGTGNDIGRRIAEDHLELFVSGDPVKAVAAELERLRPEFIALHDVGCTASARLVAAIAMATRRRVQRLAVRRQGPGVPLAVLQFVELALGAGRAMRVYSTEIDADTQTRQRLAMVLLGSSRLGAVMVGELPSHALATALGPLQHALTQSSWRCGELLLLPMGTPTKLATQSQQLARPAGVSIRVTPQAARPNDAWSFISGAWNRLQQPAAVPRSAASATVYAQTQPMPLDAARRPGADPGHAPPDRPVPSSRPSGLRSSGYEIAGVPSSQFPHSGFGPSGFHAEAAAAPGQPITPPMPPAAAPMPRPSAGASRWEDYARRCARIKGAVAACVFDAGSRRVLAFDGMRPGAEALAMQGVALLEAIEAAARGLDLEPKVHDAVLSVGAHHLLLRPVPGHRGVVLHLVVDAVTGNATLAPMQLERIDA